MALDRRGRSSGLLLAVPLVLACCRSESSLETAVQEHCASFAVSLRAGSDALERGHSNVVGLGPITRGTSVAMFNTYSFCAGIRTPRPSTSEFQRLASALSELPAELDADSADGARARVRAAAILEEMAALAERANELEIAD